MLPPRRTSRRLPGSAALAGLLALAGCREAPPVGPATCPPCTCDAVGATPGAAPSAAASTPARAPTSSTGVATALALDVPRSAEVADGRLVLAVELRADGSTLVDGKPLVDAAGKPQSDDELTALARARLTASPDLRAVIRAERAVLHGRVVRVLDALRNAGLQKIAFGIDATAPSATP
ncbi:MAG: biopolymer transporter ExbD [Myxococcales bacterium]|nr:biopolymer transporter ExbD [Myxococcales bacterium]